MIHGRRVLLLTDPECILPEDPDLRRAVTKKHAPMEYHLARTLRELGCRTSVRAIWTLDELRQELDALRPDVVFNVTEHFAGTRAHDVRITAALEESGVAYTGTTTRGLTLCRDKAVSKTIAAMAGVRVPRFAVARPGYALPELPPLPVMVKPVARDSSDGIHMASIVRTPAALRARIELVQHRYREPAIVEAFIDGVDVYAGAVETPRLRVLPPRMLHVGQDGRGAPLVASYHVKHNDGYRERWRIGSAAANLPKATLRQMTRDIATLWPRLAIRDYARIDFRLDREGRLWFIEANPNPGITYRSQCGTWRGVEYADLIRWILRRALERRRNAA
jgi:D-alanine-D-alanine ligase